MKLLTVEEFADEIKVCPKLARQMARSETFTKYKISFDIAAKRTENKRSKRKNKLWRIAIDRYYNALESGIL